MSEAVIQRPPAEPFVVEVEEYTPTAVMVSVGYGEHRSRKIARGADDVPRAISEAKKDLAELERRASIAAIEVMRALPHQDKHPGPNQ